MWHIKQHNQAKKKRVTKFHSHFALVSQKTKQKHGFFGTNNLIVFSLSKDSHLIGCTALSCALLRDVSSTHRGCSFPSVCCETALGSNVRWKVFAWPWTVRLLGRNPSMHQRLLAQTNLITYFPNWKSWHLSLKVWKVQKMTLWPPHYDQSWAD